MYVYRLTFTGQNWFIVVDVCISKDWMVKHVLLTGNFYLVSQEEFWKNIKVTFRKDCHLAGIQGFQSVKVLGEYLALNTWQSPTEAHAEVSPFLREDGYLGPMWVMSVSPWAQVFTGGGISPAEDTPGDVANHTEAVGHVLLRACRQFRTLP